MTATYDSELFDWNEVVDLFHIQEETECGGDRKDEIMKTINHLACRYGRDFVVRRIALKAEAG